MADGLGKRWKNFKGTPKHLIKFNGITLLERTTSILRKIDPDAKVIITTHNKAYETPGATLYEPLHNKIEIDRFTEELVEDNICFLYGDTFYTHASLEKIVKSDVEDVLFFGNKQSIVAVKIKNSEVFKYHFDRVRNLFLNGEIEQCIGWQIYLSFCDLPLDEKRIDKKYVLFDDITKDFNTPEDIVNFYENYFKEKALEIKD